MPNEDSLFILGRLGFINTLHFEYFGSSAIGQQSQLNLISSNFDNSIINFTEPVEDNNNNKNIANQDCFFLQNLFKTFPNYVFIHNK
jgi:hypothetical protein